MKYTLRLLTLFGALSAGLQAGGRVGVDISLMGQENLWAEDIFVTREHRDADYFDIFAPNSFFISHSENHVLRKKEEVPAGTDLMRIEYRTGVLGYQATIKGGWYIGVQPSVGLRARGASENDVSVVLAFDPGLIVGKQHTRGGLLAKTEAFYHNGLGARSAFQYTLLDRGSWSIAANQSIALGSYPQRTEIGLPTPKNIPERYACDLFNGVRFWRGRMSFGVGHHLGLERQLKLTPFSKSMSEWNEKMRRGFRSNEKLENDWKSPEQVRAEQMPRNAMVHDVLTDLTFAWEHMRLSLHGKLNLAGNRASSVGMRVSYHF